MSEANGVIERWPTVIPDDDKKIPVTDSVHVNTSGFLHFIDVKGNDCTRYVLAGVQYDWAIVKIFNTGTTATGIAAGYFA